MIFRPRQLGSAAISENELEKDKKSCRKFGPCGVGEKALYLNSFYIDRRYYAAFPSVRRVFKRVAMSKGGFTGKGIFASIPYLVVEYDGGRQKQCNFKREEDVDRLLEDWKKTRPDIPLHSAAAERRLQEKKKILEEKKGRQVSERTARQIRELEDCIAYLEREPDLFVELSAAAKGKRVYDRSNPAYKWAALAITLMGAAAAVYGVYALTVHAGFALYFLLFGLAAVFLFSGASVLPTARNNRRFVEERLRRAVDAMQYYTAGYSCKAGFAASQGDLSCDTENALRKRTAAEGKMPLTRPAEDREEMSGPDKDVSGECGSFPLPACYAHPAVLRRMTDILAENRARTVPEALEVLKKDLQALNSSVTVEQEEYDEIMAIKPMFLVMEYR